MNPQPGSFRTRPPAWRPTPIVIAPWGRTALLIGIVLGFVAFFAAAPSTLIILIGGFIFALIISFPVNALSRLMPRGLAILTTILLLVVLVVLGLLIMIPLLISQLTALVQAIPGFAVTVGERLRTWIEALERRGLLPTDADTVISKAQLALFARGGQLAEYLLGQLSTAFFSSIFATVIITSTTMVAGLYLLADVRRVKVSFLRLPPRRYRRDAYALWDDIGNTFRRWLGAGLISMTYEGVVATLGLWALGIPFAPLLGLWMGLTAAIPYLGAWLGAIPAVLVALGDSPLKALMVGALFVLINVSDGHLLVPRLQGKAVGAPPIVVIVAVIGGGQIFGVFGAFMAVPTLAFLNIVINFLRVRLVVRPTTVAATTSQIPPG